MNKSEAISIISKCADTYKNFLDGKQVVTEKVTGTTTACLGLIEKGDCYIPNSVLSEDIRSIIPKPPGKIFAIFKKPIGNTLYTQLTYKSQNIIVTKKCLPKPLIDLIEPSLLDDTAKENNNYKT